jgi:hypothetical protein
MELLDEVEVDECYEYEIRLASRAFIYLLISQGATHGN